METKAPRRNYTLSEDTLQKLEALARENAGENNSLMLRKLIEKAWNAPKKFGLHAPKAEALAGD